MNQWSQQTSNILEEGGYTVVPNHLLEAMINSKMNGTQLRLCLHMVRSTYGWHKEEAAVSLKDFSEACKSAKPWITEQVQGLVDKNVFLKIENKTGKKSVYKINETVTEWEEDVYVADRCSNQFDPDSGLESSSDSLPGGVSDSLPPESSAGVSDHLPEGVSDHLPEGVSNHLPEGVSDHLLLFPASDLEPPELAEHLKKDLKKYKKKRNKERGQFAEDSVQYTLAQLLLNKILLNHPKFKIPNLQNWAKTIDHMIRYDHREPETIMKVIIFAQEDEFWYAHMMSAATLRRKFDTLDGQRLRLEKKKKANKKNEKEVHHDKYDYFFNRKT